MTCAIPLKTIHVVDDHLESLLLMKCFFEQRGVGDVHLSRDPFSAIDALHMHGGDLILLNYRMPYMSGFCLAPLLQRRYESFNLKMIMITSDFEWVERNIPSDLAMEVLPKPVDLRMLSSKIAAMCGCRCANHRLGVDDAGFAACQLAEPVSLSSQEKTKLALRGGQV